MIEVRLLEGPNVYRLEPLVKVEIAIGRRRTWYGRRNPAAHSLVRLAARVAKSQWPDPVHGIVEWTRRLRREHGEGSGGLAVHRSSDPGHWIVTWPWIGAERARLIAEAAIALMERNVSAAQSVQLTGGQTRVLERWKERIEAAGTTPPSWMRDSERRVSVVSITGTNGKSTTTRLITRILLKAGHDVGTTTSDGILVNERMVEAGDWTGPGGAAAILGRSDIDVAVLETARGGILLRGVGYESNEASILTNVSSDHLDLQGIHTLPELAEVKATVCRMTKPSGWVVLNADDEFVAAIARRSRAKVAFFSVEGDRSARVRRHLAAGGRAYLVRRDELGEMNGRRWSRIAALRDIPIAFGGLARHNVANALAAAGGARALGASIEDVARGLTDFRPTAATSPGRLNVFRNGARIVIVDFAHNEAGTNAVMDVAAGIASGGAGRMTPITIIIGTAGDRPDDTLRGIGKIAAQRAQRVAIKESLHYLRGRTRQSVVGELLEGVAAGGVRKDAVPVYESETAALRAELNGGPAGAPRIVVVFVHEERDAVMRLLPELGFRPIESAGELVKLVPRLEDRARRG